MLSLFLVLVLSLAQGTVIYAVPLADNDIVVIVKIGKNSNGTYKYEIADSGDSRASHIWDIAHQEHSMTKVLDYYSQVQDGTTSGLTSDQQALLNFYGGNETDPVYIEIKEGSKGAYCDWKGNFTLKQPSGRVTSEMTPKVIVHRNDPLFTGTDRDLQAQTLVHEIGHGAMSKLYGYDRLPYTEWLHKAHTGGTISDEKLALIEGWAEFTGAYFTGDFTIANDPDNSMTDNRYAYKDIYTRTQLRSKNELLKTEGWVASTLLKLTESGTVSMNDFNLALKNGTPHTFSEMTDELIKIRPEKEGAIKSVIADASFGKLYSSYYSTSSSLASYTSSDNFAPNSLPDFNLPDSSDYNVDKELVGVIIGAFAGALIGSPFGLVGIAVGAIAGVAIGNFIGLQFESKGYTHTPFSPTANQIPEVGITPSSGNNDDDLTTQNQTENTVNLSELRKEVDVAFKTYLNSVQHGTIDEQKLSLKEYKNVHTNYRQQLMKEETSIK